MTKPLNTLDSIRQRRTIKAISEQPLPIKPLDKSFIQTLMESAYYAPYHYPCQSLYQNNLSSPLPWRFYVLSSQTCRELAANLQEQKISAEKIIGMLNSADYLIQSTWCPLVDSNSTEEDLFVGNLINMEHIAASGAAIQNLLLTATALGYENYWSSGGVLRDSYVSRLLGINEQEILLGSLFIFPSETEGENNPMVFSNGKRRDKRGEIDSSYQIISLNK